MLICQTFVDTWPSHPSSPSCCHKVGSTRFYSVFVCCSTILFLHQKRVPNLFQPLCTKQETSRKLIKPGLICVFHYKHHILLYALTPLIQLNAKVCIPRGESKDQKKPKCNVLGFIFGTTKKSCLLTFGRYYYSEPLEIDYQDRVLRSLKFLHCS